MMASEVLPGASWQIAFILRFQRLVIKAVSVEGPLNNACFITVMKVVEQTRLPVCAALSWPAEPPHGSSFHLRAHKSFLL